MSKCTGGTAVVENGDEFQIQPELPTPKGPADLFTGINGAPPPAR